MEEVVQVELDEPAGAEVLLCTGADRGARPVCETGCMGRDAIQNPCQQPSLDMHERRVRRGDDPATSTATTPDLKDVVRIAPARDDLPQVRVRRPGPMREMTQCEHVRQAAPLDGCCLLDGGLYRVVVGMLGPRAQTVKVRRADRHLPSDVTR